MKKIPDVLSYDDYRTYLCDVMQYEKLESKATLASLGKLFGLSGPALQMVLAGERNLSVHKVHKVCRALKLSMAETEFFEALVLRGQAEDSDELKYYEGKILRMRNANETTRMRISEPVLFSRWYVPALMLYLVEIAHDDTLSAQELAAMFGVPTSEMAEVLNELQKSGILAVTKQGQFCIQLEKAASTLSQKRFLKSVLEECLRRVERDFRSHDSSFSAETLTLSLTQFRSFAAEHRTLVERYMSMSAPVLERAVFQAGFFAFPVVHSKKRNE